MVRPAKMIFRVAKNPLGESLLFRRSRQLRWYLEHRFSGRDRRCAQRYLIRSPVAKLHIGCGKNILSGWLNMDYLPLSREMLYLDARRRFFFTDKTFDYIFSEHMIEHVSYGDGLRMLAECRRVLKPSGRIRISTPNLAFLVDLYRDAGSDRQRDYIKWACRTFIEDAPEDTEVFVINYFVRSWGHRFIYDEKTLRNAMTTAGFANIVKHGLQESEDPVLRDLENEDRMPPGFLSMETITLEGTKPQ
jgi:predicted SAM-dependent methyltransferase